MQCCTVPVKISSSLKTISGYCLILHLLQHHLIEVSEMMELSQNRVAISTSNAWKWKVKVKSLSRVRPSATPWTAAFQDPPSMGFSRQEYWRGVPLPSPRSLLIDSCIFSILFSRFLIIFTIIILNSFSGSLPISSSFDFCVSSLFLHLCSISLPFHYFFLTYCVWGLLSPGFKVEFFLPFSFCPPKIGPIVCVSFI